MIAANSNNIEAYRKSVNLLIDLHKLMRDGKSESKEADVIRNEMETYWYQMSEEDIERIEGMSADLYTLEPDSPIVHPKVDPDPLDAEFEKQLEHAAKHQHSKEMLHLLRDQPEKIGAMRAAFNRVLCYCDLGDFNVAQLFIEEILQKYPPNPIYDYLFLKILIITNQIGKAFPLAQKIIETDSNPILLSPSLLIWYMQAQAINAGLRDQIYQKIIKIVDRLNNMPPNGLQFHYDLVVANLLKCHCYYQLGETEKALNVCECVLNDTPDNDIAKKIQSALLKQPKGIPTAKPTAIENPALDPLNILVELTSSRNFLGIPSAA